MPDEDRPRRRPERAGDAPFRLRLFCETHGGLLAGLDPMLIETLLAHQLSGQAMTYRIRYPHARYDIVEDSSGTPIGRMVVEQTATAVTLVDIALRPAWRGRGIGTQLLGELIAEACAAGLPLRLGVRPDNPARRLYARLGFVDVGVTETDVAMERVV